MDNNIEVLRAYNFVNSKGTTLQLRLGRYKNGDDLPVGFHGDRGFRWSAKGTKIPFPVRNETWFNGFPEETMLNWLKENGWHLRAVVNMSSGKVKVYDLPKAPEAKHINVVEHGKYIVDDGDGYVAMFNDFNEANEEYQGLLIAGYPEPHLYELKDYVEPTKATDWIPVNSGKYPEDGEYVQVTYLGYNDAFAYCDAFAYRDGSQWRWSLDDTSCVVKITAWKPNCEPYYEEERK